MDFVHWNSVASVPPSQAGVCNAAGWQDLPRAVCGAGLEPKPVQVAFGSASFLADITGWIKQRLARGMLLRAGAR